MSNAELLVNIIDARKRKTKPRQSSLIKPWLGLDTVPQSLSIRIGYIIEDFFNQLIGDKNLVNDLPLVRKKRMLIDGKGNAHQIDLLGSYKGVVYHRELKCNPDLDNGKRRDTSGRDQIIIDTLQQKYLQPVDSCIFCPFFDTSRVLPGLGKVEGLAEFINNFDLDLTVEEFKKLGRNEQIHRALLN